MLFYLAVFFGFSVRACCAFFCMYGSSIHDGQSTTPDRLGPGVVMSGSQRFSY